MIEPITTYGTVVDIPGVSQAVDPYFSERIIENCRAVAATSGAGRRTPMYSVRRHHAVSVVEAFLASGNAVRRTQKHFESLAVVVREMVEPYRRSVSDNIGNNLVRTGNHIKHRAFPVYTVFTCGISHLVQPSGLIPHFEYAITRIPPYTTVFCRCTRSSVNTHFKLSFRTQYRIERNFDRRMGHTFERTALDKETVDEQLPSVVDRKYFGSCFRKIRQWHRVKADIIFRWPDSRQHDTI